MKSDKIKSNEKTELSKLMEENVPGVNFSSNILKTAGKRLKNKGKEAAIEYLKNNQNSQSGFGPPVTCIIIGKSRPFEEWPIYKVSKAIQEHVYKLSVNDVGKLEGKPDRKAEAREAWFRDNQVNNYGYTESQGLNLIFNNAYNTYNGVIKRIENKNEKIEEKIKKCLDEGKTKKAKILKEKIKNPFKEDGTLIEPPGINNNIFCYQTVAPICININNEKHREILLKLDEEYRKYKLLPSDKIPVIGDRLKDLSLRKKGIPEAQRLEINSKKKRIKRIKRTVDIKEGALLIIILINEDWVVLDGRGLLRNVVWRNSEKQFDSMIIRKDLTLETLVSKYFTGCPVISPKENVITFKYKEGLLNKKVRYECSSTDKDKKTGDFKKNFVDNTKSINYRYSPDFLCKIQPCLLASIDLGQNVFLSYKISEIKKIGEELDAKKIDRGTLPPDLVSRFENYRKAHDENEKEIALKAIDKLSEPQKLEIENCQKDTANDTKKKLCERYNLLESELPWDEMNAYSFKISDLLLKKGVNREEVYFKVKDGELKRHDLGWSIELRPQWSKETREAFNNQLWEEKRDNKEYEKLSIRKKEIVKESINWLIKKYTNRGLKLIFNIEDLKCKDNKFAGFGKREVGWNNFFIHKKENRWFIPAFKKELSNLPKDKARWVIESWPAYTSQTCPKCKYCDKENRGKEDKTKFKCVKCGYEGHADIDVATDNLEAVALSGRALSGGERSSDNKHPGPARKTKVRIKKEKFVESSVVLATSTQDHEPLANNELTV